MVYGTYNYNYSYWGESKPTNITGGPHIVESYLRLEFKDNPFNWLEHFYFILLMGYNPLQWSFQDPKMEVR